MGRGNSTIASVDLFYGKVRRQHAELPFLDQLDFKLNHGLESASAFYGQQFLLLDREQQGQGAEALLAYQLDQCYAQCDLSSFDLNRAVIKEERQWLEAEAPDKLIEVIKTAIKEKNDPQLPDPRLCLYSRSNSEVIGPLGQELRPHREALAEFLERLPKDHKRLLSVDREARDSALGRSIQGYLLAELINEDLNKLAITPTLQKLGSRLAPQLSRQTIRLLQMTADADIYPLPLDEDGAEAVIELQKRMVVGGTARALAPQLKLLSTNLKHAKKLTDDDWLALAGVCLIKRGAALLDDLNQIIKK